MLFSELRAMLDEAGEDELDKKNIQLNTMDVVVRKKILNKEPVLEIQSEMDPNMKGHVEYDSEEDLDKAFQNLNTIGDVLNYMNMNMQNYASAFRWADILVKEITAMKRDMTEDEIADLKLDFNIYDEVPNEQQPGA